LLEHLCAQALLEMREVEETRVGLD
jgi:hypothetical protein